MSTEFKGFHWNIMIYLFQIAEDELKMKIATCNIRSNLSLQHCTAVGYNDMHTSYEPESRISKTIAYRIHTDTQIVKGRKTETAETGIKTTAVCRSKLYT